MNCLRAVVLELSFSGAELAPMCSVISATCSHSATRDVRRRWSGTRMAARSGCTETRGCRAGSDMLTAPCHVVEAPALTAEVAQKLLQEPTDGERAVPSESSGVFGHGTENPNRPSFILCSSCTNAGAYDMGAPHNRGRQRLSYAMSVSMAVLLCRMLRTAMLKGN
jgi:hypothetical protein